MTINIESKLVENLTVYNKYGDAMRLILDETGEESGRVTIILHDSIGTYYWPAMGKRLKDFIISCPTAYLIDKLFGTESEVIDTDANLLIENIYINYKEQLRRLLFIQDKQERKLNHKLIRDAFDYLKDNDATPEMLYHNEKISKALNKLLGDEWYRLNIQQFKENRVYVYQHEMLEHIKAALIQLQSTHSLI